MGKRHRVKQNAARVLGIAASVMTAMMIGWIAPAASKECHRQAPGAHSVPMVQCRYQAFVTWMSCPFNAPVMVAHKVGPDTGNEDVSDRDYQVDDARELADCQQTSSSTYSSVGGKGFDVGHLVGINHLDDNRDAALETNYMTNLLPQDSYFNRHGAWRQTERIVECVRDEAGRTPLTVMAGPVFGHEPGNDLFGESHGLPVTPDAYWKVVVLKGNAYDAWLMPNSREAGRSDDFRVTLRGLISWLIDDQEGVYGPVLEHLTRLSQAGPTRVHLRDCGVRQD